MIKPPQGLQSSLLNDLLCWLLYLTVGNMEICLLHAITGSCIFLQICTHLSVTLHFEESLMLLRCHSWIALIHLRICEILSIYCTENRMCIQCFFVFGINSNWIPAFSVRLRPAYGCINFSDSENASPLISTNGKSSLPYSSISEEAGWNIPFLADPQLKTKWLIEKRISRSLFNRPLISICINL